MSFFVVPSFCAIMIKAYLLWSGRPNAKKNRALITLLCALLVMNLVEFSSFFLLDRPEAVKLLMHAFYFTAAFAAAAILNLFLDLTGNTKNHLTTFNWVLAAVIAALTLIPGFVIAGVENIGYSFTRIPGAFYNVWSVYIVSTLLFSVILLLNGYSRSNDALQRRRCLAVLIGLFPFVCIAICVTFMLLAGVKINATVLLSCSVIFFLIALIYSEQRLDLFQLLGRVPFTEEYALRSELTDQLRQIELNAFGGSDQPSLKDQIKKIEALYIDLAIVANDGNKTHAAAALGISNATLHRKATRKRLAGTEHGKSHAFT